MVGVGARGNTALQLKESMGLTNFAAENGNSDSVIGSLIQSIKVGNPRHYHLLYLFSPKLFMMFHLKLIVLFSGRWKFYSRSR